MSRLHAVDTPPHESVADHRRAALVRILEDPGLIRPVFQPIVDVSRGVVAGFEMLARFDLPGGDRPAEWFDSAARLGFVEELDAAMLQAAVICLPDLPPNTFLTANVTSLGAASDTVRATFRDAGDISGLVVELTEQTTTNDPKVLIDFAEIVRASGGMIAIDDLGTGYSSMQRVMAIRPEFLKIDRSFVTALHGDEAKVAAVEMMGGLADRIDAWIIAEGIEEFPELDRIVKLGVPLVQGFLLSRPAASLLPDLNPRVASHLASVAKTADQATSCDLAPLVDRVEPIAHPFGQEEVDDRFKADMALEHLPTIDELSRPGLLIRRSRVGDERRWKASPMIVHPGAQLVNVSRRAMTRASSERFSPLVYASEEGKYVGLVRIESMLEALALRSEDLDSEVASRHI